MIRKIGSMDPKIEAKIIKEWEAEEPQIDCCLGCGVLTGNKAAFVPEDAENFGAGEGQRTIISFHLCQTCQERVMVDPEFSGGIRQMILSTIKAEQAGLN